MRASHRSRPPADGEGSWTSVRTVRAGRPGPAHTHHRGLRRTLALGAVAVFAASTATLAVGSGRIMAEQAAFSGPPAPLCVPSTLNRSDLLPGTKLAVSPLPDALDASPQTQISLLWVGPHAGLRLGHVGASGSLTGVHPGRLLSYSQGDGASFMPNSPFQRGETVTVHGELLGGRRPQPIAFHFAVAVPDPIPVEPPGKEPAGGPTEVQHFNSAPSLNAPSIQVTTGAGGSSPAGDIFLAPYSGPGGDGPMIVDETGRLVWFDPLPSGVYATNLQLQAYNGKPVLTWWQGHIPKQGFGEGEEMVADSTYKTIARVRAGNGLKADLHDFHIEPNGTALTTAFDPIHCNLTAVHGPRDSAANDSVFQEIDLRTQLVRREWTSLDHVALSESYSNPYGANAEWPYDYFHANSLDPEPSGVMLISARNTWALYEVNEQTGEILAREGGRHPTVKMESGTPTAFQHDATLLPNGLVTVFDNGGVPMVHPQSRGILVALNRQTGTETLVAQFLHPAALKAGSQGNVQALPGGNLFIGWGAEPWFSEFTASGTLLFDARMPAKDESYRTYRFPWTGTPSGAPSIAASAPSASAPTTVYASWNGATTIASWRVLAGPAAPSAKVGLFPVASAPASGFETAIPTPGPEAYVQVQALNAAGAVLGTSAAVKG
jgi:Arylsulfotransferase (ASST)